MPRHPQALSASSGCSPVRRRTATCRHCAGAVGPRRQLPGHCRTTPASRSTTSTSPARRAGPVSAPAAPPVPAELEALMRRMRLPYLRKAAPDVLATARAQRWDPAEVLRVLLAEEVTGRDAATRRTRRKTAAFPAGKTFATWRPERVLHPRPHPGRPGHPGMDRPGREPGHRRAVRHRQVATSSRPSPTPRSTRTCGSPGSPSKPSPPPSAGPRPTDRSPGPSPGSAAAT